MTNPLFGRSFTHRRSSGIVMQEGIADFLKIIASGEEYVQHFATVLSRCAREHANELGALEGTTIPAFCEVQQKSPALYYQ